MGRTFPVKNYISSGKVSPTGAWYRRQIKKHPFLFFGLPFMTAIVSASFFLTPATALRYERYDLKNKRMSQEEALQLGQNRRKFDIREEYYKLSAKKTDEWENKRYPRKPGDHDGIL